MSKWIPTKERLPDVGQYVLAYYGRGCMTVLCLDLDEDYNKYYWVDDYEISHEIENTNVIAWMPLPESYKEGETDG